MKKIGWLYLTISLLIPQFGLATTPAFETLTIRQGLSNSYITSILQDQRGLIWIATTDGLNRYNGYEFTLFRHDPFESTSMAGNWVAEITEDGSQHIWLRLGIGGLDRLDPATGKFSHYNHSPRNPYSLSHDLTGATLVDSSGHFWIGTQNGLNVYEPDINGFIRFTNQSHPTHRLRGTSVLALVQDSSGRIWCGTPDGGLTCIDSAARQTIPQPFTSSEYQHLAAQSVHSLHIDSHNRLWVGTQDAGLFALDLASGGIQDILLNLPDRPLINSVFRDHRGLVWFTNSGMGIHQYDPETQQVHHFLPGTMVGSFSNSLHRIVYEDRQRQLWVGTSSGLFQFDRQNQRFTTHRHHTDQPQSLSHNVINTLFEDRTGMLWIGTWGGGVNKLNRGLNKFNLYDNRIFQLEAPAGQSIRAITADAGGHLWLGSGAGLIHFDHHQQQVGHYLHETAPVVNSFLMENDTLLAATNQGLIRLELNPQAEVTERMRHVQKVSDPYIPPIVSALNMTSLSRDSTGMLWIGSSSGLLRVYADSLFHSHAVWRHYQPTADDPHSLPSMIVFTTYVDRQGTVWVGTGVGGLSRYVPEADHFVNYIEDPDKPSGINNRTVTAIYDDSAGRLWVGTYSGGLNRYDPVSETFAHYTARDGLPGNKINEILEDQHGHLWLSTNNGLSRFDPDTETFKNYDVSDGLQSNEFNVRAAYKSAQGELFFGGTNGLNSFYPDSIRDNTAIPPVRVTAFKIFDQPVQMANLRNDDGVLELSYQDDFIAFEFVALDYTNPAKNQYAYRLEGFDRDWIYCGTRRYASYTNLEPGRYVFRVIGANNDGVWNRTGVSCPLVIRPPFWQTWWFYGLSIALIVLAGITFHKTRMRIKLRRALAIEQARYAERERVREQISRDYHDEMGHQITKIGIFTELIKRNVTEGTNNVSSYVSKVADAAERLSRDTRDFIWTLNPDKDSLYEMAIFLQDFGTSLFDGTDRSFQVEGLHDTWHTIKLPMEWRRHLTLIFKEGMTNILRHTDSQHIDLVFEVQDRQLRIDLKDDGAGFDPEFVQIQGSGGNGLRNMRTRAEKIKGRLEIHSQPGAGTTLRFRGALPPVDNEPDD